MRRIIAITMLAVAINATAQLPASASAGAPRVFIVQGHGWGHGRGMGQYGARALAEAGTQWYRILPKYYTGIHFAKTERGQRMRVLLFRGKSVVVKGDSRALIVTGGKKIAGTKRGAVYFWIGRAGNSMVIEVASSPTGPWHKLRVVAPRTVRITGARAAGVVSGSTIRWYRGSIDLVPSGRRIDVINNIDLERYVAEVVPREMPAWWPMNALKSQAVAARTYALRVAAVARANHRDHDICASTACQVFGGYAWTKNGQYQVLESHSSNIAAWSTVGYIMTYRGKPILAEYSSSTGGYTTSGGLPYLAPRPDPWDGAAPLHSWSQTISASQIQAQWPSVGSVIGVGSVKRDGRGDFGGRALSLVIYGSRGSLRVSATSFQYAFGLPSDWFRLLATGGKFSFTFDIAPGTTNAAVHFLQERLRAAGFFPKTAAMSNYFGPITKAALQRYQRANHISATGYLGPRTRARLNAS
jgi:stage II sporulation protein D